MSDVLCWCKPGAPALPVLSPHRKNDRCSRMRPAPPATGEGDREALAELLRGRLTGFAAADAVLAAGFRRAGSGEARLTRDEEALLAGALGVLDTVPRVRAVKSAVEHILADRAARDDHAAT